MQHVRGELNLEALFALTEGYFAPGEDSFQHVASLLLEGVPLWGNVAGLPSDMVLSAGASASERFRAVADWDAHQLEAALSLIGDKIRLPRDQVDRILYCLIFGRVSPIDLPTLMVAFGRVRVLRRLSSNCAWFRSAQLIG